MLDGTQVLPLDCESCSYSERQSDPSRRRYGSMLRSTHSAAAVVAALATGCLASDVEAQTATEYRALLDQYCVTCHNQRTVDGQNERATALTSQLRAVGLALDALDVSAVGTDAARWEPVVRKLRAGLMPPAGLTALTVDGWSALAIARGLSYTDFYKAQVHTAARLEELMQACELETEGEAHRVPGSVCYDCLQTRRDQVRAVAERDEWMEANFDPTSHTTQMMPGWKSLPFPQPPPNA